MRRSLRRPLAVASSTVAIALLLTASAEAQRKKAAPPAKKKPATTAPAKPKPDTTKPAEEAPAAEEKKPAKKAAEEETEKPKEPEKEKEPEKATESGGAKPVLLDLALGIRGFQRHLGYKSDVFSALPTYDLNGAPEADIAVGIFPIKNATGSITAGITGSFGYAFALGSTYAKPQPGQEGKFTTKAQQFSGGAKVNFNFGTSSVGVGGEFGIQQFVVSLPAPVPGNAQVPDVDYKFIRPNVTGRFGVADKLSLLAGVGYLVVLSAGEIKSPTYFENASVGGVDVNVGGAYEIAPHVEIRAVLDYRRYFYTFNPDLAHIDPNKYYAGGALDQYLGAALMAGFRF